MDPRRVGGDAEGVLDRRRGRFPAVVGRGGVGVALRDVHVAPRRHGEGARAGCLATGAVDDLEGHDMVAARGEGHALARPLGLEDAVAVEIPEVAEANGVAGHRTGLERGGDGAVVMVFLRLPGAGEGRDELHRADVDVRAKEARVAIEVCRVRHPPLVPADVAARRGHRHIHYAAVDAVEFALHLDVPLAGEGGGVLRAVVEEGGAPLRDAAVFGPGGRLDVVRDEVVLDDGVTRRDDGAVGGRLLRGGLGNPIADDGVVDESSSRKIGPGGKGVVVRVR